MEPAPGTLLQGTGVAPVLSEMVAAHLLDRPFEARFGGRARLLRYSDDALVLSDDPVVVAEALAFVAEALASQYTLHPDKTSKYPLDLRGVALRFLGKWVSAVGIVTPMPRVRQLVDALVSTELNSRAHKKACGELRRELLLDTTEVMQATSTWLEIDGPEWFELFRDLHLQWQPQRRALLNRLISPRRRRSKAAPSHAA